MKKTLFFSAILILTIFLSCNKNPGEGGTSSITGKVWVVDLNGSGDTVAQYYALDQDVYILYGEDDQTYDEDFSTSLDGSYAFHNLTPGKYTVFAYSKCEACPSGLEVVQKSVEITEKKQTVTVEDLVIIE